MAYLAEDVRLLWDSHVAREFPARLRGREIYGVDVVLLDSDVAGLVRSWLDAAGELNAGQAGVLRRCKADLARVSGGLTDQVETKYLARLTEMVDAISADGPALLSSLSRAYDRAETNFLRAVSDGADRSTLSELADVVALAAESQMTEAYRALHAGEEAWMPLDELSEAAEQLAGLWADLAAAYAGRPLPGEGSQRG
jgi:hypothetical protein